MPTRPLLQARTAMAHNGETDSLEVAVDAIMSTKYTPFLTQYTTKSLGTRLKLKIICDDGIMIPELKNFCYYYFHINVSFNKMF